MKSNELRRRKREQNGHPAQKRKRKEVEPSSIYKSLMCLIISATIFTVFLVLYIDNIPWYLGHRAVDHVAKSLGYHKPVHAVVIDAGSTGSRVLAFTFHESYLGNHLVLDKELFEHTKPGLSSFADNPAKGVATINSLLEKAKKEIPKEYWNKTPLVLKATAGLRLLPADKAENLLNAVRALFKKTPFLTNDDSVTIMDGTDEGIFSWFTVNFLTEKLSSSPSKTVAALDLGGASTQVTFAATTPASLSEKDNIHQAVVPGGRIPVYTHSFLGLGLMAARKEIITYEQGDALKVTSECINHIIKDRKFHFAGVDYFVSGPQENYPNSRDLGNAINIEQIVPVVNFAKCSEIVADYVQEKAKPPAELPTKPIFAFSYYFDRAAEVGLIDESTGGHVKISDFKNAAEKACHDANADQPFMCLDLTFIWILLEKGLGLRHDTQIFLFKKIHGHEISWALGAAYNILKA